MSVCVEPLKTADVADVDFAQIDRYQPVLRYLRHLTRIASRPSIRNLVVVTLCGVNFEPWQDKPVGLGEPSDCAACAVEHLRRQTA